MQNIKPESPLIIEEILILWGYEIHYKDASVCSLVPKDRNSECDPVCISQDVGPVGLSTDIIEKILFDARIDPIQYAALLAKVKAHQKAYQAAQARNL